MAKVLKLKKPLAIDGQDVTELAYDFEQMSMADTIAVSTNMGMAGAVMTTAEELDPTYHAYLFAQAVQVASKGKISVADVMRMSALDARRAATLARDFFYVAESQEKNFDG